MMTRNLKRILIGLIPALLLYSWLGFLLLPGIVLSLINTNLNQYGTQPAQLQRLEFNPFTLKLDLWQLRIGDTQDIAGFEQLSAQLAWSSLWRGELHFKTVELHQPNTLICFDKQGILNLTQLFTLPPDDGKNDNTPKTTDNLIVYIEQFAIRNGQIQFNDQRPNQAVHLQFTDLNLSLEGFTTRPDEQGQLSLQIQASDGTRLTWQGELLVVPLQSNGRLEISSLALTSWWPYLSDLLDLQLHSGQINLRSDYQLRSQPDWQVRTTNSTLELEQLKLSHQQQPLLQLDSLSVGKLRFDLAGQQLFVGQVQSTQLETWVDIDEKGQLNWQKITRPAASQSTETSVREPEENNDSSAGSSNKAGGKPFALTELPWHVRLDRLELSDYQVYFNDSSQQEPVQIELKQLGFQLDNFDSQVEQPVSIQLKTHIGEQGQIDLQGQVNPHNMTAMLQLNSQDIDLRPAQAWMSPYAKVELVSGLLNTELSAQLQQLEPLKLAVEGDLSINQLHMRDQKKHRDLLRWHSLSLQAIQLQHAKATDLKIARIHTKQPYVRLIIDEQLNTNISQILASKPEAQQQKTTTADKTAANTDFTFALGEIQIENGSANFADFSLTPHFATAIQNINGRIGSINNQENQATPVEVTGAVDRYAPVTIKGTLTPFDPLQQLDIAMSFNQVELTTLTPYSGKFAGYRIHKGRLNLELNYQVNQGMLNAENTVLLEQLQLGEKVDSPNAVDLPIPLAIALLKDVKGNIKVQLPVKGDLNNPEFSVMPIVWQTLRNLVTRAAAAPFKLLGNLASNDQELDKIGFLAGDSSLTPSAQQSLSSLAQALQQRPMLKLNIEGTSAASFDGPAVAQRQLHRRYQQQWYSQLQKRGRKINMDVHELDVPEKEQNRILESLYQELPESARQHEPLPDKKEPRLELMRERVLAHYAQNSLFLRMLAQRRAQAIREYLIERGQIPAQRLYLMDVNERHQPGGQEIQSLLHLDVL